MRLKRCTFLSGFDSIHTTNASESILCSVVRDDGVARSHLLCRRCQPSFVYAIQLRAHYTRWRISMKFTFYHFICALGRCLASSYIIIIVMYSIYGKFCRLNLLSAYWRTLTESVYKQQNDSKTGIDSSAIFFFLSLFVSFARSKRNKLY